VRPLLLPLPGNEGAAEALAARVDGECGRLTVRRFPDGESYVRLDDAVGGRSIVLVCTLDRPDEKLLPLLFAAAAARELGVARIGLVAPYLAYMRQDRRFNEGEAVTSRHFASLISNGVDWLVTVDPHLHRISSLGDVYPIEVRVVRAASRVAEWIAANVERPLLVGPDAESVQWVRAAAAGGSPYIVLTKVRRGDRDVEVSVPEVGRWSDHTPVLVDDIVSTARTMIETVGHLRRAGLRPPVCVGVHAILAGSAYQDLLAAGAALVATSNTIPHASNAIDLTEAIAEAVRDIVTLRDS
jgi:ribose-phosphate pyrophosphokinase